MLWRFLSGVAIIVTPFLILHRAAAQHPQSEVIALRGAAHEALDFG